MNDGIIIIGQYELQDCNENDKIWISAIDGEGGQFSKSLLEPILKKFYDDNF